MSCRSLSPMCHMQMESLAEEVDSASAQGATAKAACVELEQRRQQLLDDNSACESAIGDVFGRKEVRAGLLSLRSRSRRCMLSLTQVVRLFLTSASSCWHVSRQMS